MGRTFDRHILDMVEFGVLEFKGLHEFTNDKIASATKPCLLFSGPIFEHDPDMKRVKSLMIDFFRGPVITHVRLAGLEHALQVKYILLVKWSSLFDYHLYSHLLDCPTSLSQNIGCENSKK